MPSPIPLETLLHNRYRIVEVLTQGDYGWAYIAQDLKRSHERCVLEEFIPLKPDALDQLRDQFQQEVSVLTQFHHPQISRFRVVIVHSDGSDQRLFWVRDYIEGFTYRALLKQRLAQGYVFSETEVLTLLENVLPVLRELHDRDVIHQNLNLDSIVLRTSDRLPILIQFELVRDVALILQLRSHGKAGAWGYAPLEQRLGDRIAEDSDLYALAAIAVVLLTGREPEELYNDKTQHWSWQEWVVVSPKFAQVLERMLLPNPNGRYATAVKVIHALRTAVKEKTSTFNVRRSKLRDLTQKSKIQPPEPLAKLPIWQDVSFLILVSMFVGLTAIAGWRLLPLLKPELKPDQLGAIVSQPSSKSSPNDEQKTQEALRDRRKQLGISFNLFTDLVDELFYAQHPQLQSRNLDSQPEAARFRAEWNALAETVLQKLANLSQDARRDLGRYNRANYNAWVTAANQLNVSGRSLSALTDARFVYWFPDQQGKPLNPRKFGQVWYAIARDQVSAFRNQSGLSRISTQSFSEQTILNPGQGKVYSIRATQGKTLNIEIKAPDRSTRLSLFPDQESELPKFQNSSDPSWSGKITKTGIYELAIVSQASESISYQLNIKSGS